MKLVCWNIEPRALDAVRVDFVLVSEDLVRRIASIDILARLPLSDHAPLRMELREHAR